MTSICVSQLALPVWKGEYDVINRTLHDIPEPQSQFDLDSPEACETLVQRHSVYIELSKQVEHRITARIRRMESLLAQWKHVISTLTDLERENAPKEVLYLVAPQAYLRAELPNDVEEAKFMIDVGSNVMVEFSRGELLSTLRETIDKLTPMMEQFVQLKTTAIKRKTRCEVSMGRIRQSFANAHKELQMQQQQMMSSLNMSGGLSVPSTIREDDGES